MGRRNTEDDAAAPPSSAPKREDPEQEAASLASAAESSTRSSSSGTRLTEVADVPKISRRVPGAYASKSTDLANPKRLAFAKETSGIPSLRTLDHSSSMSHSSPSMDFSHDSSTGRSAHRTKGSGSLIHNGVRPGAQAVGSTTHVEDALEEYHQRSRVFDVAQSAPPDMTPIAAEVHPSESNIRARVDEIENRLRGELMRKSLSPAAVPAEMIVNEAHQKKRGCVFWIVAMGLLLLIVAGGVGTVFGVMLNRNSTLPAPSAPSPAATNLVTTNSPSVFTPPCTLCFDGGQPDLESEISRGFTCADLQADLSELDDPNDLACLSGQAEGWFSCSCSTLPQRPSDSVCSSVCPADARPPAFDSQACIDFEIYVELAGLEENDCAALIAQTPEDCVCLMVLDQLRTLLGTISTEEDLLNTTTPQYKAMEWLVSEDPANLDMSTTPPVEVQTRYLGALLWFSFAGESWVNEYNFLSADATCDWNDGTGGLMCSESSGTPLAINLGQNNLVGTLPGLEIASFKTLEFIELYKNDIKGSIPSTINNLASLQRFAIHGNKSFGGTLPASLFELRQLALLFFNDNILSGSLPSNIGDATALSSLSLASTSLTGTIPSSISRLTSLVHLLITSTSLSGPLPSLSGMRRLEIVLIQNNLFTGTIPDHYGQSPIIETLQLGHNDLTGSIPDFSGSRSLQDLGLEENRLAGNLERFFNTTPTTLLNEVTLGGNQLTGTIPTSIGLYTNLEGLLWLQGNLALEGTLPTELGLLTGLVEGLDIGSTFITGALPSELGRLTMLAEIDFSQCLLSGEIPSELGDMTALTFMDLDSNQLTGTIPTEFGNIAPLVDLDLNTNKLTGTIPSQLGNLENLERVSFADNLLTGTVPSILAAPPKLELFLVQFNELTGSLDPFCAQGIETVRADCDDPAEIVCDCCESCY